MKKIYLLMLLVLPFVYACSDDDDDKDIAKSLSGTTWEATVTDRYHDEYEDEYITYKDVYTLSFRSETFELSVMYYEYDDDDRLLDTDGPDTEAGRYEVNGKKVHLYFTSEDVDDFTLTVKDGKLEGRYDGETVKFTRK